MTSGMIIDLVRGAVFTILQVAGPVLLVSVGIGLFVAVLQTATSIQEQTLSFVPKIIAVLLSLLFFGNNILTVLLEFSKSMFDRLTGF